MGNPKKLFSQIYDTYIGKIYKFVFLKVNSQEIAEDLTSEAFSRTWVVFKEKQEEIKNVRAFLYKTANNLVIDHYREKAKTNTISIDSHSIFGIADPRQDLEKNILINSDMEVVKHALLDLKKDYQNIVIWRYLEDFSITEISELLNRSESATRVLLHRALKALKERAKQV
ncbi:MAG: RNA polymerase sigma factor [Patescibacteria group bacterium]|nr:RNA polymerase sigma factor [Patescibacteria group bacterium]